MPNGPLGGAISGCLPLGEGPLRRPPCSASPLGAGGSSAPRRRAIAARFGGVSINRSLLAPWDPARDERYFTKVGQLSIIGDALAAHHQGSCLPHVILNENSAVARRVTLNGIVRGPFLSCSLGYWVNEGDNRRGLASGPVDAIKRLAFDELGLHRVQAETMADNIGNNIASQRVLDRNEFVRFGLAPKFLKISGRWEDHLMYQALNTALK